MVTGPWNEEMADAVTSGVAPRVVLNHALGYDEPDLSFLVGLPIRELKIVDRRIADLTPVSSLAETLEGLDVEVAPDVRIDLTAFPNLHRLGATWAQVSATIDAVPRLRRAALDAYDAPDLAPLAPLGALEAISLKERPRLRSLDGLGALPAITHLGVFGATALTDVQALRGRERLVRLDLQACRRLTSVSELAGCTGLHVLDVAEGGDLDSAAPLGGLLALEELYAYGSTRFVDPDLSALARLPRLVEVRMQSRRHYVPSVPDLKAALEHREDR